jgi:hypothetical protein
LTKKAEDAISQAQNETDFNKKTRIIRDYITSNHFYPPGKNKEETKKNAENLQSNLAKKST